MKIVIIDANAGIRAMYCQVLDDSIHAIQTFPDFSDAMTAIEDCDMLISANRFSGYVCGFEIIKNFIRDSATNSPKICAIISGDLSAVDIQVAEELNINILSKPVALDSLTSLLSRAVYTKDVVYS